MFQFSKRNSEHDDLYRKAPQSKKARTHFAVEDDADEEEEQPQQKIAKEQ